MGMAVVNFHQAYSCCGDTLQQLHIPVCMHVNITVFFALPPCCVVESYSRVCVLVDDHAIFYFNHRRDKVILHFCFCQCVSQCHKFSCLMFNSYSVERILSIVFISIFVYT